MGAITTPPPCTPLAGTPSGGEGYPSTAASCVSPIRTSLWGCTQHTLKAAFEARGGQMLKIPAMDSSRICAKRGHLDTKSRNSRQFKCTKCEHTTNTDVNAGGDAANPGQGWTVLKAQGLTDGEATRTLWKELRTTRKRCAGDAGARDKPPQRHRRTAVQTRCGCNRQRLPRDYRHAGVETLQRRRDPDAGMKNSQYETYTHYRRSEER